MAFSGRAAAQAEPTITLGKEGATRTGEVRATGNRPLWINRADCDSNNDLQIPLTLTNFNGLILEAWAGKQDCTTLEARKTNGGCVQLLDPPQPDNAITVTVKARELIKAAFPMADDATLCSTAQEQASPVSINIDIMLLESPSTPVKGTPFKFTETKIDLVGPVPPTNVSTGIGESQLVVKWTANDSANDTVTGYRVYCEQLGDTGQTGDCTPSMLMEGRTPDAGLVCGEVTGATSADAPTKDLVNGARYAIGVLAIDDAGNLGGLSSVTCATPQAVTDFYEAYREAGGEAGGGFCSFTPSQGGPRAAGWGFALALIGLRLRRGKRSRLGASQLLTVALIALGMSHSTRALAFDNYRGSRAAFGADGGVVEKPVGVELGYNGMYELRFGPYAPKIDDEFSGTGPYEQIFGNKKRVLLGFEADWQALQVDRIASLGPGIGFGVTQMSGKAPLTDGSGVSAQENAMTILPMYGVGVLRVTVLQDQLRVPLVPYAKAGLGYALWWTTTAGELARVDGKKGRGSSYGPQWAAGLMLNLGFLDRSGEAELRTGPEFESAYLFGEWLSSDLGGFGKKTLNVGANTWFLGLALRD